MELHRKIYPGINYSDPSFRSEDSGRYQLNIFLNDSQFLFSIVDPQERLVKHVQSFNFFQVNNQREFAESVRLILDSEELFYQTFDSCNVAFYHEQNTLLPTELFDTSKARSYLKLNVEMWDNCEVSYDVLEDAGLANVYCYSTDVKNMLEAKFNIIRTLHTATPLLRELLAQSQQLEEPSLFVYVQPKILEVLHAKKGKPVFFNAFQYTTPEDFVYYILYACQHLHLDPEKVHLYLLGEIVKDSVLYEFAFKYIRHVHFAKRPSGIKINDGFNMPEHFYYNLFCIGL